MCVVAIAWRAHPRWRLIVAGNRDEFHARPSAGLARWEDAPHLIAGRDLQSGGSWLGISEEGRFAVVTNLAGMGDPQADMASRGALIADFLRGVAPPALAALDRFNPFNLFVASGETAHFLTNRPAPYSAPLPPGVHSLSNGVPDAPWPRKQEMHRVLENWLADDARDLELLFGALRDERDLGGDVPRPIFINDGEYGTRCSTVIAIDAQGRGVMSERRFGPDGQALGQSSEAFFWPVSAID